MIEDINGEWETDSKIDRNRLSEETLKSPNLHQKYLVMLMDGRKKIIKLEAEMKNLKWSKYMWYKGRMSREDLEARGWKQYQGLKPSSTEMNFLLENDPDISSLQSKVDYIRTVLQQLESILVQIKNRDWMLKNHIEFIKFQAGG